MAPLVWTLRVYWKRYTFAAVASIFASKYAAKRIKDNNIIRAYCRQARVFGEERVASVERDGKPGKTKKIVVLLNPAANKRDAKIQFMKYSAPLFHLSGTDVTVVESQQEGHLRSLMNYIDPKTDCIVVAGGDGTLMEVLTGLMRRTDIEEMRSIPIGVIPLGRENRLYQSNHSTTFLKSPVRMIGDATMDIIRSQHTEPLNLMQIKPETGRPLYALSSLQWGPLRDAHENRDGFKLFGKLRLLLSHINVALRRWPTDYVLHLWYPAHCRLEGDLSSTPPPSHTLPLQTSPSSSTFPSSTTVSTTDTTHRNRPTSPPFSNWLFTPIRAHCLIPHYGGGGDEENKPSSKPGVAGLTKLAGSDLEHRELKVVGFSLSVGPRKDGQLQLHTWLDGSIEKRDFIKQGWEETLGRSPLPLPSLSLSSTHLVLQPVSQTDSWVSIDGELYEAMPVSVTAIPAAFRLISSHKPHS